MAVTLVFVTVPEAFVLGPASPVPIPILWFLGLCVVNLLIGATAGITIA
jgi:hypothetical protein